MSKYILVLVFAIMIVLGPVPAEPSDSGYKDQAGQTGTAVFQSSAASAPKIPPGEEQAKTALGKSPRHGEYVDLKIEGSDHPLLTWVVYPERKDKAPVVIVIHEIYGLTDWIRAVADQLAADGFIAVAPDFISGKGPGGGGTASLQSRDDVVKLIRGLAAEEVNTKLNAVRSYAIKLPAANGKTAVAGFCWGGGRSFGYAAAQPELNAAVVYYGTSPEEKEFGSIKAPVLGLYGGDDARVNATIEPAAGEMKKLGKVYEVEIYKGAGHGFLRQQDGRDGANMRASQQAWQRMLGFLRKHL
ncbi:MAG: Carboxymethylenebutenolidase [Nitrospirae bacterium]|nr:Carboxymethylenebutenolidase [Nitrospirota bacterium]